MDSYEEAAAYASQIEQELRNMGVWQSHAPPPEAFQSTRAFFGDTMSFYQWLQFVLLARVRQIVESRGSFPSKSSVCSYAVRELDGENEASQLIDALRQFDRFIETLPHASA